MKIQWRVLIHWITFPVCFTIPSLSFSEEDLSAVIKHIQSSVVTVLPYDKNGEVLNCGTGFFINRDGHMVTNIHVLQGVTSAQIKTVYGRTYTITSILAQDNEAELVLTSVDIPPRLIHPLILSATIPDEGERVIVICSPSDHEQKVSDGTISGISKIPTFGTIMKITTPLSLDRSCGPVLNMRGEIVGLVTFQSPENQNIKFAIHTTRLEKLIPYKDIHHNKWIEGESGAWFSSEEGLCNRGIFYLAVEDYRNALSCFEKAVKINPRYASAHFFTGYSKDALGQYQEAIEAYRQAVRIEPYFVEAHLSLGKVYDRLERYADAVESYKHVARIQPENYEASYKVGTICSMLGRHTEAVKALKQAIRIKPDFAEAHLSLGTVYLNRGDKELALEEYKILKDLNRDAANGLFNLIFK